MVLGAWSRSLPLTILHFQLRYVATKVSLAVLLGLCFGILFSQLQPSSSLMNILAFPGTLGWNGGFNLQFVLYVRWNLTFKKSLGFLISTAEETLAKSSDLCSLATDRLRHDSVHGDDAWSPRSQGFGLWSDILVLLHHHCSCSGRCCYCHEPFGLDHFTIGTFGDRGQGSRSA